MTYGRHFRRGAGARRQLQECLAGKCAAQPLGSWMMDDQFNYLPSLTVSKKCVDFMI